jgi:large subunit ribosomal protein L10
MNRTEKQQLIDDLHTEFGQSPHAIVVDFRGLGVNAATEFRRKVRASGSRYRVVKNSLALRALKDTPLEKLGPHVGGTTGIAYTAQDPVVLAKTLVDFIKDNPQISLKAGLVAGSQLLDANGVKALSSMPSLPELRSKLLGLLNAPASKLVRLLATPATQMARVLRAQQDKLEGK